LQEADVDNSGNQIGTVTINTNVERQTPRNEFGAVLSRTAQEVVKVGSGLVSNFVPVAPMVSAAVSSVSAVVSSVAGAGPVQGGLGAVGGAGSGRGEQWQLLDAQRELNAEGQKFNMAYLQLQNEMQRESREHNTVSNIMKVRHDSAKAAINNIR
jgi:hypothetical protein